jgi:2-hydroxychromene-2-carboxylate isomerase
MTRSAHIDFWFTMGSTYSYLTVMRLPQLAERTGVAFRWRPFHLLTILQEMQHVPFADKPAKMGYMWRDIERRAARYGLPFKHSPPYPVDPENLANRVGVLAALEGWCPEYTRASYAAWFLEGKAPGEPEHLAALLRRLGRDPAAVMARAESAEIRGKYAAETDVARKLGIFGSPSFVAAGEMFWGDDRLEDALLWLRCHA